MSAVHYLIVSLVSDLRSRHLVGRPADVPHECWRKRIRDPSSAEFGPAPRRLGTGGRQTVLLGVALPARAVRRAIGSGRRRASTAHTKKLASPVNPSDAKRLRGSEHRCGVRPVDARDVNVKLDFVVVRIEDVEAMRHGVIGRSHDSDAFGL